MKKTNSPRCLGRLLRLSAAVLIAGASLTAQEPGWHKYNYGIQLGMLKPLGELADAAKIGWGLGAYMEKVWSNSWALRGRLEYTQFAEAGYYIWSYPDPGSITGIRWVQESYKVRQAGAMLDVIYYMNHRDTIYPFAGVGYFNRSVDVNTISAGGSGNNQEGQKGLRLDSEIAYCLGVGWNFTSHIGAELKYVQADWNWVQLSLLYRF